MLNKLKVRYIILSFIAIIEKKEDLTDFYITNKITAANRYYIDNNLDLWGYGYSESGQLGIDTDSDVFHSDYVKLASNLVSVDCSNNGYFCIFLTEDGNLYGVGANMHGLLGQDYGTEIVYSTQDYIKVLEPVLLMTDVSYARAGKGLGNQEKTIAITGDLEHETTHFYSDTFIPVTLEEYSEPETREILGKLDWVKSWCLKVMMEVAYTNVKNQLTIYTMALCFMETSCLGFLSGKHIKNKLVSKLRGLYYHTILFKTGSFSNRNGPVLIDIIYKKQIIYV